MAASARPVMCHGLFTNPILYFLDAYFPHFLLSPPDRPTHPPRSLGSTVQPPHGQHPRRFPSFVMLPYRGGKERREKEMTTSSIRYPDRIHLHLHSRSRVPSFPSPLLSSPHPHPHQSQTSRTRFLANVRSVPRSQTANQPLPLAEINHIVTFHTPPSFHAPSRKSLISDLLHSPSETNKQTNAAVDLTIRFCLICLLFVACLLVLRSAAGGGAGLVISSKMIKFTRFMRCDGAGICHLSLSVCPT